MSTVELCGESFRVAERISSLAVMRFAKLAKQGVDADTMAGAAALYEVLEQCIDPADWSRFEEVADRERVGGDELLGVVRAAFAEVAGRPTSRPSDSSDGPRIIEPSSTAGSSSPDTAQVIGMFNERGRGDLALLVRRRQESLAG